MHSHNFGVLRNAICHGVRRVVFASALGVLAFGLTPTQAQAQEFRLELFHASDFEAGVPALNDAPRFSAVLNGLRNDPTNSNTLFLSSGDNYIPSPFFSASADPSLAEEVGSPDKGRGDIVILNAMGVEAAALGNHEFDEGPARVQSLITPSGAYPGAAFPYLSSNLDFSMESALAGRVTAPDQPASTIPGRIAKTTVITVNGEQIGIVGATTPQLPRISTVGNVKVFPTDENDFDALATIIQQSVDGLTALGINKIILLAHMQQINVELELSERLRDVDIIVAGGSNTILADATDRLRVGDTTDGPYPILREDADGEDVAVVNTDGNYRYVGRLVVSFDANGNIIPASINAAESGVYATDAQGVADVGNPAPTPKVVEVTDALRAVIASKDGNIFGKTSVYLNGLRDSVRTEETNLGNLSADANLFTARQTDSTTLLSLKNGGGIRDSIGAIEAATGDRIPPVANAVAGKESGDISQLDIENALRFNNTLSLVTVTASQLKQLVEHGVAATAPGATPGRFPQIGGFRFTFNPSLTAGSRVRSVVVNGSQGPETVVSFGQIVGDPNRTFRLVTLSFLAGGGDGYPFSTFASQNPERFNRVDLAPSGTPVTFATPGSEQDAFADYVSALYSTTPFSQADTPIPQDQRIRRFAPSNTAPVLDDQSYTVSFNRFVSQNLPATDADGDALAFRLADGSLPSGLTLNPNGTINGRVGQRGSFTATIEVVDEAGNLDTAQVTFIVSLPGGNTDTVGPELALENPTSGESLTYAQLIADGIGGSVQDVAPQGVTPAGVRRVLGQIRRESDDKVWDGSKFSRVVSLRRSAELAPTGTDGTQSFTLVFPGGSTPASAAGILPPASEMAPGAYQLLLTAQDNRGNVSTSIVPFTIEAPSSTPSTSTATSSASQNKS